VRRTGEDYNSLEEINNSLEDYNSLEEIVEALCMFIVLIEEMVLWYTDVSRLLTKLYTLVIVERQQT
jgi:hypothetical protein